MNKSVVALWVSLDLLAYAAGRPQFKDYPVTDIFRGTHASPVLSSRVARDFRTQLRNGTKYGPHFAGHYTIVRWGCGAGCVTVAVIDAISGQVWFAPFRVEDAVKDGHVVCDHGTDFEIHSELFIAQGAVNGRVGTHYFRWHEQKFSRLPAEAPCSL